MHREFVTQPFSYQGAPFFGSQYELVCATGVGNDDTPNPEIGHSWSDNGINFGPAVSRSLGEKGNFGHRVMFRRMGRIPRSRVLKFFVDEPCETTFYVLNAKVGQSSAA